MGIKIHSDFRFQLSDFVQVAASLSLSFRFTANGKHHAEHQGLVRKRKPACVLAQRWDSAGWLCTWYSPHHKPRGPGASCPLPTVITSPTVITEGLLWPTSVHLTLVRYFSRHQLLSLFAAPTMSVPCRSSVAPG